MVLILFPLKSLEGTPSDLNSVGSISVSKDCRDVVMKKLALQTSFKRKCFVRMNNEVPVIFVVHVVGVILCTKIMRSTS